MSSKARLGRPPSSSSAETRQRIVDVARRLFAAKGYESTSNRMLAEEAGLTTGAIYHYFDSKLHIYTSVYEECQNFVYDRFIEVSESQTSFAARLEAVLEAAHELNRQDPTLATFLGSARVDAARSPELAAAIRRVDVDHRASFFRELVALGVRTGEIDPTDERRVTMLIRVLTTGLVDAVSSDNDDHRAATDAIKSLLDGKLIRPAP